MKGTIAKGLRATATLWPAIGVAFGWLHQAAHVLGVEGTSGAAIRKKLGGLLGAMPRHRRSAGTLKDAVSHFVKVTRSYGPGLFVCYDVAGLPGTNNDLEQLFGAHRYHERRASGRKGGSPGTVLRGSVRVVAALATRTGEVTATNGSVLVPIGGRRRRRVERRRFRRNPEEYLKALENKLIQSGLPS
ncbi:hypothetical protein GobsT_56060 [Gemmata obscuriglobus]|uniref:Transposase n=1 Tax=Gemmata obscuriglobus TaxID=114 RepID=A0A2Z3H6I3_9BACT|nr:hypothetical protein [Gemmata obscuriglobus]AWM36580.1 hypothetical protein C1280_05760 [Gemmata obscuriglobus]QEG30793.1 hypothetical protein GobsT_56060 [Gemmata obscuriglobus]VTS10124.1 MULE transposase, conserved domain OS=Ktedonobacter racemifer DSM 44963 GN=Krac_6184 PE=4 SV=1 [Gemmata obscuriglobus UQM 2246]